MCFSRSYASSASLLLKSMFTGVAISGVFFMGNCNVPNFDFSSKGVNGVYWRGAKNSTIL